MDLDDELRRLRDAVERIGANLLTLEQDPTVGLLDAAELTGASADRWSAARSELAGLFESYASLRSLVDRATTLRGSRRTAPAELAALLHGPSIVVTDVPLPASERALLAGSRVVQRCTPDELLGRMATRFAGINELVVAASRVWDASPGRVRAARERLSSLGEQAPAGADAALDDIARKVLTDPLSVDERSFDELDDLLRTAEDWDSQLAAAQELLQAVRRAVADRDAAAALVAAKVRTGAMPETEPADDDLRIELDHVADQAELGEWQARASERRDRACESAAALRALLTTRDELRGRLDAYHAKAAHLGRLEDPHLADVYGRAHAALFTAPTDLTVAGDLVSRYQEELA